jgi:hypothetical protein
MYTKERFWDLQDYGCRTERNYKSNFGVDPKQADRYLNADKFEINCPMDAFVQELSGAEDEKKMVFVQNLSKEIN